MCLAVPGKLVDIETASDGSSLGIICYGSVEKKAGLAFVPEAQPGDYLLVHAGFAISVLNEEEALSSIEAFSDLQAMNQAADAGTAGDDHS